MTAASSFSGLLRRALKPKYLAVLEACLIGLISAIAAVILKQAIASLEVWRSIGVEVFPRWLVLPGLGILGGWVSGKLIERVAPEASGSGIPLVKAALNYVPISLDMRVALVKMVTTILALGSGMMLGRQGPTVQIGAAIAAQVSRWTATSPAYQRQLVAAGAAAGLAAGFNAPIAGVLFVIEELLHDLSDFTLGTAILASFVGGVVSRLLGGRGLIPSLTGVDTTFELLEIPLLILLGILAGILGGLFSRGVLASLTLNRTLFRSWTLADRMALTGGLTGISLALLPPVLRSLSSAQNYIVLGDATWFLTILAFISQFVLILLAYSSGAPGGLFAPTLVLGAALGSMVGKLAVLLQLWHLIPADLVMSSTTVYALAGMGAFFSAVTRGPITAIVIVFEMTADFNLVLPLMIGSVIASLVAEKIVRGSIYQHLLQWRGIYLEEHKAAADQQWEKLTAAEIMQSRVESLASQMTIREATQAFARSHHRGFPVVDQGKLVGILTQSDLAKVEQQYLSGLLPLSRIMTHQLVTVNAKDSLTHVLYLLNRHQISRLPVTEGQKLVGIITRADIIRAESDLVSGEASSLGPKPEPSYGVYQTQAPATGRGRILVPLHNPETADALLRIAVGLAQQRQDELECLSIQMIPRHCVPSETPVDISQNRQLLEQAAQLGKSYQIPVHTQVRVAHDLAPVILEVVRDRHIDLLVMEWKGKTSTPGRIFGDAVDTAIRQVPCDVMLVKLSDRLKVVAAKEQLRSRAAMNVLMRMMTLNRWLIPIAGGPNAQYAITLLPALTSFCKTPEIRLCQVFHPNQGMQDLSLLNQDTEILKHRFSGHVISIPVCSDSVSEAIIDMAKTDQCDVIVLGASREGLLQQVLHGNIPEAIAHHCPCTVILVRKALSH